MSREENERAERLEAAIKAYDFPERLALYSSQNPLVRLDAYQNTASSVLQRVRS